MSGWTIALLILVLIIIVVAVVLVVKFKVLHKIGKKQYNDNNNLDASSIGGFLF